jgi:hypothetical protein
MVYQSIMESYNYFIPFHSSFIIKLLHRLYFMVYLKYYTLISMPFILIFIHHLLIIMTLMEYLVVNTIFGSVIYEMYIELSLP